MNRLIRQGLLCSFALGAISLPARAQDSVVTFTYDNLGNIETITRPLGRTTAFGYDEFNRMIQQNVAVGSTSLITLRNYDGLGQLSSITDPNRLVTTYTVDGLGNATQLSSPDTQSTSYTVDNSRNVKTITDARGKTTSFQYDMLNRVTLVQYQSGGTSKFEYDGGPGGVKAEVGNLTKISDESGATSFTHDLRRRVLTKTQVVTAGAANVQLKIQYVYGTSGPGIGKLKSIVYPSGVRVNYAYGDNGRISRVALIQAGSTTEVPILNNITYAPSGMVESWSWGTGMLPTYQRGYDLDGRLTSFPIDLQGMVRAVIYDAAGMITGYRHSGGPNSAQYDQTFTYDAADRLIGFTLNGVTTSYSYDANGNRNQETAPNVTYTYTYDALSNRLNSATFSMPRTYSYDSAGNRTADGLNTYTYTDLGQLAQVRGGAMLDMYYNAVGQRVVKIGADDRTYYIYDQNGHAVGEYGQGGVPKAETIYLDDLPIAVVRPQGYFYVLSDHIATPLVLAQPDGAIVWDWRNRDPFGKNLPLAQSAVHAYDHRFPGQIADSETGLFYNYYRDYDPQTGRYLQSDPIGLAGGINTYLYVSANPLLRVDPFGLEGPNSGWSNGVTDFSLSPLVILSYYSGEMSRLKIAQGNGTGPDNVFHCVAACKAKKAGNDVNYIRFLMNQKENSDYVRGRLGMYGDGRRRGHDEMVEDNDHDKAVNEVGLSCPEDRSCEAQCDGFVSTLAPKSQARMREYLSSPEYKKY